MEQMTRPLENHEFLFDIYLVYANNIEALLGPRLLSRRSPQFPTGGPRFETRLAKKHHIG